MKNSSSVISFFHAIYFLEQLDIILLNLFMITSHQVDWAEGKRIWKAKVVWISCFALSLSCSFSIFCFLFIFSSKDTGPLSLVHYLMHLFSLKNWFHFSYFKAFFWALSSWENHCRNHHRLHSILHFNPRHHTLGKDKFKNKPKKNSKTTKD